MVAELEAVGCRGVMVGDKLRVKVGVEAWRQAVAEDCGGNTRST